MKEALMMMGGMTDTDGLTAEAAHVLEGETFLSAGSDDPQTGEMPDCGASQYAESMGEEGDDYALEGFPEGWYHGSTKARLYKGTVREYLGIAAGKIASGQTIAGVAGSYDSDGTVSASDMKAGIIAYSKGKKVTGSQTDHGTVSKTLNAGESYTIGEGFYGAGKVVAATLASQQDSVVKIFDITAAKIAKGQTIAGVAGSWYGNKAMISALAVRGFNASSSDYQTYEENSFTMPADGMVYYGGANAGYKHISKCQILKNGAVVDSRDTSASAWYSGWRGTMFDQSFSAKKGDVIKVICEQSSGTHGMSCIQAVIVY